MKKMRSSQIQERPAPARAPQAPPAPPAAPAAGAGFRESWVRFWFTPADPIVLHALRVLGGGLLLYWLLGYAGQVDAFFGPEGWFGRQALNEAVRLEGRTPALGWSVTYLAGGNSVALNAIYWASVLVLALFTFGVATRVTAVLSWVVVASFQANPALDYDPDALLAVLAFYLMVGHLLTGWSRQDLSPLARITGPLLSWPLGDRKVGQPLSSGANVAVRLVQVHFALVMVTSGLHKLNFGEWWSGVALWYPLHPAFETTLAAARHTSLGTDLYLALLSLATYAALAWQLAFPAFAWRPRARALLLGGAAAGWVWCGFISGLPLFGPAVMIFCLAYVTPREWHWLGGKLRQIPGPGKVLGKLFAPRLEKTVVQRS